jgi:tetratricopeptide (TPR) repeat protein
VWQVLLATLFLAAVSLLVWKQRMSRRYLATGWLWYLGTLVPVIGLIQVGDQAMADRYAYIPLIGVFVMAVWSAADGADNKKLSFTPRLAGAAVILAVLSFLTWRQIAYWRSDYDLWTHALKVTKGNAVAEEGLSAALLMMGRPEEALPGLERAAQLRPMDPIKHVNLGANLVQCGRVEDAIKEYKAAIEVTSDPHIQVRCYDTLATLYDGLGDYSKVRESYQRALLVHSPEIPQLVQELSDNVSTEQSGPRYLQLGMLQEEAGNLPQARTSYEQALRLDPGLQAAKDALAAMEKQEK